MGVTVGDMGGGGGGNGRGARSNLGGVVGISGRNEAAEVNNAGSFTSPSANCLNAEPAPFNATTYWAWEAAKACRLYTACFKKRFRALHLATTSSFSTFEFEHPIFLLFLPIPACSSDLIHASSSVS
jgi:hypothetical protein